MGIAHYFIQKAKNKATAKKRRKEEQQRQFRKHYVHKENIPQHASIDKSVLPTHGSKRRLFGRKHRTNTNRHPYGGFESAK